MGNSQPPCQSKIIKKGVKYIKFDVSKTGVDLPKKISDEFMTH